MLKQGDERALLLHNRQNRYCNETVPVAVGSTIFTDIEGLMTPGNTVLVMQPILFQGNIDRAKDHAIYWLKVKRGVQCNRAGGYVAEYNVRFFMRNLNLGEPRIYKTLYGFFGWFYISLGESFLNIAAENYTNVFNN